MFFARAADGREHGRKDLRAVLEIHDAIAVDDRWAQQRAELAQELCVVDAVVMFEVVFDALFATDEIERKDSQQYCDGAPIRPARIIFVLRSILSRRAPPQRPAERHVNIAAFAAHCANVSAL
jgi:hypothetical protein